MLEKWQPHLYFYCAAWIKFTAVWLVHSVKQHSAQWHEIGVEPGKGGNEVGGIWRDTEGGIFSELPWPFRAVGFGCIVWYGWFFARVLPRSVVLCCLFCRKKMVNILSGQDFPVASVKGALKSHGSVQLSMKYALCNFIYDNTCQRQGCHTHHFGVVVLSPWLSPLQCFIVFP